MSRFNTKSSGTKTKNYAGGEAFKQSPELELVSILLTSFAQDQFYRSADSTFDRLKELLAKVDSKFAAKAAIYARNEFGMRSITHVMASELAKYVTSTPWAKRFYEKIVRRPDDMCEILAYHNNKKQKISKAMQKGLAKAFDKFDQYQLAKYRGDNNSVKLVDVVNAVHPKPIRKNAEALKKLVEGTLRSERTWESKISEAGQGASTEEEKEKNKSKAWKDLIDSGDISYFALLRNLRNIIESAPESVDKAIEILTDEKRIRKSLVLPFRYTTAYDEIIKMTQGRIVRKVIKGIEKAIDISCKNVPVFEGETLIALDVSGSMHGRPEKIAALFTAILAKSNDCDTVRFHSDAKYFNVNTMDSVLSITRSLNFDSGGTNFRAIFPVLNKAYDRIIILSDMQGWMGYNTPTREFSTYKEYYDCNPIVYSFDLQGYGTMQMPERSVFCLAGFSDKVFDMMRMLEQDRQALVNEIEKIEIV